jgi:hypothetical protein
MKKLTITFAILFSLIIVSSCTKDKVEPSYDPPVDHTINQDGFKHKTGLNDPLTNCIACHGADLKGGTTGVSCFECHGTKW